jgi:hypothetical protein
MNGNSVVCLHVKFVNCISLTSIHTLMYLVNVVSVGINAYVHDMP